MLRLNETLFCWHYESLSQVTTAYEIELIGFGFQKPFPFLIKFLSGPNAGDYRALSLEEAEKLLISESEVKLLCAPFGNDQKKMDEYYKKNPDKIKD